MKGGAAQAQSQLKEKRTRKHEKLRAEKAKNENQQKMRAEERVRRKTQKITAQGSATQHAALGAQKINAERSDHMETPAPNAANRQRKSAPIVANKSH